MKRIIFPLLLALALLPTDAMARPGFYIGFGTGYSGSGGADVPYDAISNSPRISNGTLYTTQMNGGLLGSFKLGFNVLGYGALETMAQYLKPGGDNTNEAWMANFHVGARIYPAWHWRGQLPTYLQPLEPSIFIGWGATYQGYDVIPNQEVAWSSFGSWRFGLGLEYFVASYFKVGMDYNLATAPYSTFIFNFQDGDTYAVSDGAAGNTFHQFLFHLAFHFGVEDLPIQYETKKADTTEG
ncbi:MAG: hypothetical protein VYA34_15510 [Myxococcota bacterium]|nr:hypothetical protein [Myxococcota bacterium]